MECKCEIEMTFISCYDNPNTGFAYNLYVCNHCGMIMKDNVWNDPCNYWWEENGKITKEK